MTQTSNFYNVLLPRHQHVNQFQLCETCVASIVLSRSNELTEIHHLISEACRFENLQFAYGMLSAAVVPTIRSFFDNFGENVRIAGECLKIVFEYIYLACSGIFFLLNALFPDAVRTKSALEQDLERKESERKDAEWRMKQKEDWAWKDAQQAEWEARRERECERDRARDLNRARERDRERKLDSVRHLEGARDPAIARDLDNIASDLDKARDLNKGHEPERAWEGARELDRSSDRDDASHESKFERFGDDKRLDQEIDNIKSGAIDKVSANRSAGESLTRKLKEEEDVLRLQSGLMESLKNKRPDDQNYKYHNNDD